MESSHFIKNDDRSTLCDITNKNNHFNSFSSLECVKKCQTKFSECNYLFFDTSQNLCILCLSYTTKENDLSGKDWIRLKRKGAKNVKQLDVRRKDVSSTYCEINEAKNRFYINLINLCVQKCDDYVTNCTELFFSKIERLCLLCLSYGNTKYKVSPEWRRLIKYDRESNEFTDFIPNSEKETTCDINNPDYRFQSETITDCVKQCRNKLSKCQKLFFIKNQQLCVLCLKISNIKHHVSSKNWISLKRTDNSGNVNIVINTATHSYCDIYNPNNMFRSQSSEECVRKCMKKGRKCNEIYFDLKEESCILCLYLSGSKIDVSNKRWLKLIINQDLFIKENKTTVCEMNKPENQFIVSSKSSCDDKCRERPQECYEVLYNKKKHLCILCLNFKSVTENVSKSGFTRFVRKKRSIVED